MGSRFGVHAHFILWCFLATTGFISGADRIEKSQSMRDGGTIVSTGQKFSLGFFSPKDSSFRYLGIWYHKAGSESVIWVANRETPISGTGGVLSIGDDGNLILKNGDGQIVWSSNGTTVSRNSTAVLTATGNLELQETGNPATLLWQSFDDLTDTYLPDMRVHFNSQDGETRAFTSWRAPDDPSPGNYTMGVDPLGSPQIVLWEGQNRRWRSGHWNGLLFTGVPGVRARYLYGFRLLSEPDGRLYFMYALSDRSDVVRFRLSWEGVEIQERSIDEGKEWNLIQAHPVDECDIYNRCGPFGKCSQVELRKCSCMEGFVPKDDDRWSNEDWSGGCVRRTTLQCEEDGFLRVDNVKLPDLVDYVGDEDAKGCEKLCLQNCSCAAYAFVSGINCMIWSRDLVDVQQFVESTGSSLYIRLAQSELSSGNSVTRIVAVVAVSLGTLLVFVAIWLLFSCKRQCREVVSRNPTPKVGPSGDVSTDNLESCDQIGIEGQQAATGTELAMLSFNCVAAATDNFSDKNKLGQGGFGLVYKGMLSGRQEIAVKRLSKKSGQGLQEFKNEITLIAKLQHRNLVRLLGCCTEGDERMLLYEYMPNNSLDSYLFDPEKKSQLDWSKRFNIIEGVARGLLYLHRDSRLRIIHRDLKASNILLDEEMNPKISDFGMARIFGGNQNETSSTNRVVGTFGYMAPEYAVEGLFSLKSDVYSFGVLLLEIITGQRNTRFRTTEYLNIIGYAWDLWENGRASELLDPSIPNPCSEEQVIRCVHVGMLCVQDVTTHRPDMQAVVLMLESDSAASLPAPRQPTFMSTRHNLDEDVLNGNQDGVSSNNVTVTVIIGR